MSKQKQTFLSFFCVLGLALISSCGGGGGGGGGGSTPLDPDDNNPQPEPPPVIPLQAKIYSDMGQMTLSWKGPEGAAVTVQYSTDPNCNWVALTSCSNSGEFTNVTSSTLTLDETNIPSFSTAHPYYFVLKTPSEISPMVGGRVFHPQPDGPLKAMAMNATGTDIYLGGQFSHVGVGPGAGVTFDLDSGNLVGALPWVDGTVNVAVSDNAGGWFIGGQFSAVEGQTRTNLAHITSTGVVSSWNATVASTGTNPSAEVRTMVLSADGNTLYVGGVFNEVSQGTTTRNRLHVAAFSTSQDVAVPLEWNAGIVGTSVDALVLSSDGSTLYVGGQFSQASQQTRENLAAFSTLGNGDLSAWNPSVTHNTSTAAVRALAFSAADNTLYVGGIFNNVGQSGQDYNYNNLAALNISSSAVVNWNAGIVGTSVNALTLSNEDSQLYVGGQFTAAGSYARKNAASFATNGNRALNQDWDPNFTNSTDTAVVKTLALSSDNTTVYVGGQFSTAETTTRNHFAAVDAKSGAVNTWDMGLLGNDVRTLALSDKGNTLYMGGDFHTLKAQKRSNLAVISGGKLTSDIFDVTGATADVGVNALRLSLDKTTMYVGGEFATMNGVTFNNTVSIDTTTRTVKSWTPNTATLAWTDPTAHTSVVRALFETRGVKAANPNNAFLYQVIFGGVLKNNASNKTVYSAANFIRGYGASADVDVDAPYVSGTTSFLTSSSNTDASSGSLTALAGCAAYSSSSNQSYLTTYYAGGDFSAIHGWNPYGNNGQGAFESRPRNQLAKVYIGGSGPWMDTWDPGMSTPAGETTKILALALRNYENNATQDPWGNPTIDCDTKIFVGGTLGAFPEVVPGTPNPASHLVALEAPNGTTNDTALPAPASAVVWNPQITGNSVNAVLVSLDGSMVYAGGDFNEAMGEVRNNLVAISLNNNPNAEPLAGWNPQTEVGGVVQTLMVSADGQTLYVGGNFQQVSGSGANGPQSLRANRYFDAVQVSDGTLR